MKKWISTLACLAALWPGTGFLHAQARTFDLTTFSPPPGWEVSGVPDHLTITTIDNVKGIFCQLVVYQSQPSKGDAAKDFSSEWNELRPR
jgi:hypothetical protein